MKTMDLGYSAQEVFELAVGYAIDAEIAEAEGDAEAQVRATRNAEDMTREYATMMGFSLAVAARFVQSELS